VKPVCVVVGLAVFGWALVTAADARHEAKPTQVAYQVVTVGAEQQSDAWQDALEVKTPVIDELVDWDEVERQTDCLWVFLTEHFGHDITLDRVLAAAAWTDELGGACLVIGEDDEEQG
jgi:hypothetical protein